jgi:hypothetical protein
MFMTIFVLGHVFLPHVLLGMIKAQTIGNGICDPRCGAMRWKESISWLKFHQIATFLPLLIIIGLKAPLDLCPTILVRRLF